MDTQSGSMGGKAFAFRVALFYAALFLIYGVHLPYLPVWLDWRGLTPGEIGAIVSAPYFIRLAVTPAVAFLADRTDSHRLIVIATSWACLAFAALLTGMDGFWPIFFVAVAFHISASTIMPITETVAVRGVKAANLDYGRMRLWGSLTFIATGLAGGALMDGLGPPAAVWMLVFGACATVWAAHYLPRPDKPIAAGKVEPRAGMMGDDALRLVRSPVFLVFLTAVGIIQASHGTFYAFGALHWRSLGLSSAWVGVLWAIAVLAEVALFAYSSAVVARVGPVTLILAGAAAAVVRWLAMTLDPPLWALVPLQLLHALTYGASHLGAIHFIGRAVPEGASGTAQALYATFAAGVLMGGVTLASGPLYAAAGAWTYALPALLAGAGVALCLWLRGAWQGGELWSTDSVPVARPVLPSPIKPGPAER